MKFVSRNSIGTIRKIAAACGIFIATFSGAAIGETTGTSDSGVRSEAARLFAAASSALLSGQSTFPQEWRRTATLAFGEQTGTLVCRKRGSESLCATKAGIFSEILYQHGSRFYRHDLSGLSRELHGSLRAHERTLAMLTDGSFLAHPEWAVVEAPKTEVPKPSALQWVVFRPPGGERMRVGFDARHYPAEITSQGDFGVERIYFDDYRSIDGVMWPFATTIANPNVPAAHITYTETVSGDAGNDAISAEYPRSLRARVLQPMTVPLEERNDHLYVPVHLGNKVYRFLVDSGAQAIVLDPRIAADIPASDAAAIGVRASEHTAAAKLITLAGFSVGGVHFPAQPAIISDLGTTADGSSKIDGILGFPFFAQAAVTIDLAAKTMTISAAHVLHGDGKRCPLILDRGVPEIEAALLSGPRGSFVLDTGSSDTMLLYAPFAKRAPGVMRAGTMREKTYGIGGSIDAHDAQLEGVKICGMPWRKNLPVHVLTQSKGAFANRRLAGSIGTAYFGDAVLGFDVQASAVYVKTNIAGP